MVVTPQPNVSIDIEDLLFVGLALLGFLVSCAFLVRGFVGGRFVANPVFLFAVLVGSIGWLSTAASVKVHGIGPKGMFHREAEEIGVVTS